MSRNLYDFNNWNEYAQQRKYFESVLDAQIENESRDVISSINRNMESGNVATASFLQEELHKRLSIPLNKIKRRPGKRESTVNVNFPQANKLLSFAQRSAAKHADLRSASVPLDDIGGLRGREVPPDDDFERLFSGQPLDDLPEYTRGDEDEYGFPMTNEPAEEELGEFFSPIKRNPSAEQEDYITSSSDQPEFDYLSYLPPPGGRRLPDVIPQYRVDESVTPMRINRSARLDDVKYEELPKVFMGRDKSGRNVPKIVNPETGREILIGSTHGKRIYEKYYGHPRPYPSDLAKTLEAPGSFYEGQSPSTIEEPEEENDYEDDDEFEDPFADLGQGGDESLDADDLELGDGLKLIRLRAAKHADTRSARSLRRKRHQVKGKGLKKRKSRNR